MKRNEARKKINISSQQSANLQNSFFSEINKNDKSLLPNKKEKNIEKELFMSFAEKIKMGKNHISINKINKNSNSQLLFCKTKKEKSPIKLPNNILIFKNKEEIKKIKTNNYTVKMNNSLNKSQSINNINNIFPVIEFQKNKNKVNATEKNKINCPKLQFHKTELNFFNNFKSNQTNNIYSIKNANYNGNKEINKNNNNNMSMKKYRFIVRPENCGYLVIKCFRHRKNWKEIKNDYENQNFNFKWQQNTKNIFYNSLSKIPGYKQMVNHFEFHNVLTNKANLFYNMMKYAELLDENVFKYIPFTILFEYNNDNYFKKIEKFQLLFNNIQNYIVKYEDINQIKYKHMKGRLYGSFFPFDNSLGNKTAINIPETHLCILEVNNDNNDEEKKDGKEKNNDQNKKINNNLWLIKAPNLNRGMCIKILNDINLIQKYITYYNRGIFRGYNNNNDKREIKSRSLNKKKLNIFDNDKDESNNIYQSSTIIIQKYIEKPLLYFGRKFDIRIWVLLTHDLKVYVFKEGHLKCCSVKYDLSINDTYSHLTNYSFQKYNDNFGKYELGNEVSYDDLQNNIDIFYNRKINFKRETLPKIYNIIKLCFQSVKSKINTMNRNYTFEIFGFDFMIDCNFEPFLIEINTNPGLEESSPLIKMLIPRMLDDALRLTVDKEFDTIYDFDGIEVCSNDKNCDFIYQSPFPVNGYLNSENIFKLICDLNANEKSKKFSFRKFHINSKSTSTRKNFMSNFK